MLCFKYLVNKTNLFFPHLVDGLTDFPFDRGILNSMKRRIDLARKIDQEEHKMQKVRNI